MKKLFIRIAVLLLCTANLYAQDTKTNQMTPNTTNNKLSQSLGNLTEVINQANGLLVKTTNGTLQLTVYTPSTIRVRLYREQPEPDFSYAVVATPQTVKTEVSNNADNITLSTDLLRVVISKNPVRLRFLDKAGKLLNEDDAAFGTSWIGEQATTYKKLQPGERFIGLGEKSGNLDRKGEGYTNWNTDAYGYGNGTDPLYTTMPFYMGVHSQAVYGIFLDNTYKTHFNFGASNDRFSSFTAEDGDMNYYFMHTPTVAGIIEAYTHLTGRTEIPPLWALGFQQCRYSYYPDEEVLRIARTFREKKIPADVMYLDIHYMDAYKIFTWNAERFPQPKKMLDELKSLGFNTTIIVDPGIKVEKGYEAYESGLKNDLFLKYPDNTPYTGQVWPGWCHFPDFTNPQTRTWWGASFEKYVADGITGFWNDMNEPSTWGQRFPELVEFDYDGQRSTFRKAHNVLGLQMTRSTFEGTKKLLNGRRPMLLTRSGYSGIQRYSAVWTGDNQANDEHMLLGVRLVNSMGLTGVPFAGMDVGGFIGASNPKLFSRWMSLGAFTPFFRAHTELNNPYQEPWSFGEQTESISRNYIELRYKLLPYLYSAFYESSQNGMPISRSLAINYTHDPMIYDHKYQNQYLFGPSIMVAPVASSKDLTKVYLPAGGWYNLYNDRYHEGGEIAVDCPLDSLPVFVKAGAIIPMQSVVQHTGERPEPTLRVHVYQGKQGSSFVYYEDDGLTYNHKNGAYIRRTISYDPARREIVFGALEGDGKFDSKFDNIKIILHNFTGLTEVSLNGTKTRLTPETVTMIGAVEDFNPLEGKHKTTKLDDMSVTFKYTIDKVTLKW